MTTSCCSKVNQTNDLHRNVAADQGMVLTGAIPPTAVPLSFHGSAAERLCTLRGVAKPDQRQTIVPDRAGRLAFVGKLDAAEDHQPPWKNAMERSRFS